MTTCDHCKTSDNWPGPLTASVEVCGWHTGRGNAGPSSWHFDLCKECAVLLKKELDRVLSVFIKTNLKRNTD